MRFPTSSFAIVPLLALAAACSSGGDGSPGDTGAPPATEPDPAADVHGTFHFFTGDDSHRAEVQQIVYTDPFEVLLEGLPPNAEVDLVTKSYSPSEKGSGYTSTVTFVADASGAIDTKTMAPARGSYAGVDPDGIVWSMAAGKLAEGLGPDRAALFFQADANFATFGAGAVLCIFRQDTLIHRLRLA